MSYRKLYVSPTFSFAGSSTSFEEADYVILGFPFDGTCTYRSGAQFAPDAIRRASLNLESYSIRSGTDVEELRISDIGNLEVTTNVRENLKRLRLVVNEIVVGGKFPVIIGGEHTLTLGVIGALEGDFVLFDFDAHADLRDRFMGVDVSHATFMRRVCEQIGTNRVVQVGTRALCQEEANYIKREGVRCINLLDIRQDEGGAKRLIEQALKGADKVYLSVDFDVLDPSFAPAVANPEPDGIDIATLLDLAMQLSSDRMVGFDVVEVTPHYDRGVTALGAARFIFELLCDLHSKRRGP